MRDNNTEGVNIPPPAGKLTHVKRPRMMSGLKPLCELERTPLDTVCYRGEA